LSFFSVPKDNFSPSLSSLSLSTSQHREFHLEDSRLEWRSEWSLPLLFFPLSLSTSQHKRS
jgi:hypothetical protein